MTYQKQYSPVAIRQPRTILIGLACLLFFSTAPILSYSQQLQRYTTISERTHLEGMEAMRSFDTRGIAISKKRVYHPLAICQYGILAYSYFENTGDSIYYKKCVAQAEYFKDTSLIDLLFDGKGIGLPYDFKFWDMKAPWYSGMTQGAALSYLLRYRSLTGDESITPTIQKIAYTLIQPVDSGGTMSLTPEGCAWIEEYPNSKKSKSVLNGYINGLIGLYEYTEFFPDDKAAKEVFDSTYDCLLTSLEYYDSPDWSFYDRSKKKLANNYLHYQIYEMQHLYELFGEPLFKKQMMIWAHLAWNKKVSDKHQHVKRRKVNFSDAVEKQDDLRGIKAPIRIEHREESIQSIRLLSIRKPRPVSEKKMNKLNRKGWNTELRSFQATDSLKTDYLTLRSIDSSAVAGMMVQLHTIDYEGNIKPLTTTVSRLIKNGEYLMAFPEMRVSELLIDITFDKKVKEDILSIDFYDEQTQDRPWFGHWRLPKTMELKADKKYQCTIEGYNSGEVNIFYKAAKTKEGLKNSKWKARNTIDSASTFTPEEDSFYRFLVVYEWNSSLSFISEFKCEEVE